MKVSVGEVSVSIDGTAIVTGAELAVTEGSLAGLVGPNGCGKSTLLRTVYRALRPVAGVVLVGGEDVWTLSARQSAQRTAVVAQEVAPDFELTAFEVVAMGRTPHKAAFERDTTGDRRMCHDALARVGLVGAARRTFATLSGGEKQRVLVARAIAQRSKLLILDEPTNHLDVRYQLEVLELVRDLGITALAALHDLNLAAAYCDVVHVMRAGTIAASGPPPEVLTEDRIGEVFGVHVDTLINPSTGRLHLAFSPAVSASRTHNLVSAERIGRREIEDR